MSQENVELVRRAYEAWNEGGAEATQEFWADDVEWHDPPNLPDSRVVRGRTAVAGYLTDQVSVVGDMKVTPVDVRTRGATVALRTAVSEPAGEAIGLDWRAGPAAIVADGDRLARALDNLLANAFEHGTAPVRVRADVRERHLRISIEDRGPRAGERPAGRRTRRRRGLEIVAQIAREHGGRFTIEPGAPGTIAAIELPLASLPARALAAPQPR